MNDRSTNPSAWTAGEADPPPPPPPPPEDAFHQRNPLARLDAAFPPHSTARLVLLLVAAPLIAAVESFRRSGGVGLMWLVVSIGTMVIVATTVLHARREAKREPPPTAPPPPPPVLADREGRSPFVQVAAPFFLSFLLGGAFFLIIDPGQPQTTLMMASGFGLYCGSLWHLRGTIPGLILISLGGGACVTFVAGVFAFIGSLWGTGQSFNWVAWWLGSSALIAPCLWPAWRRLRHLRFEGPANVVVAVVVATTFFATAAAVGSAGDAERTDSSPDRSWEEVHGSGVAPEGAPSQNEAAARLFAAWRFGNRTGADDVASPGAVDALFGIQPTERDRLLGCGTFDRAVTECRIESMHAGIITLNPLRGPTGAFWIEQAVVTDAP